MRTYGPMEMVIGNLNLTKGVSFLVVVVFQVLKFNLTESGLLCVLPWLTMAVFANVGGWIADTLVSKGLSITSVRKARTYVTCTCYFTGIHVMGKYLKWSKHLLFRNEIP